jgi:hypothetical protein
LKQPLRACMNDGGAQEDFFLDATNRSYAVCPSSLRRPLIPAPDSPTRCFPCG